PPRTCPPHPPPTPPPLTSPTSPIASITSSPSISRSETKLLDDLLRARNWYTSRVDSYEYMPVRHFPELKTLRCETWGAIGALFCCPLSGTSPVNARAIDAPLGGMCGLSPESAPG